MEWGLGLSWSPLCPPGPELSLAMAVLSKHLLNEAMFTLFGLFSTCCPQALSLLISACPSAAPSSGFSGQWVLSSFQWVSSSGRHGQMGGWEEGGGCICPLLPPWSLLGPPHRSPSVCGLLPCLPFHWLADPYASLPLLGSGDAHSSLDVSLHVLHTSSAHSSEWSLPHDFF